MLKNHFQIQPGIDHLLIIHLSYWLFNAFAISRATWEICSRDSHHCPYCRTAIHLCWTALAFLSCRVWIMWNLLFRDFLLILLFSSDIISKCRWAWHVWWHIQTISPDKAMHSQKIITLGKNACRDVLLVFFFSDTFSGAFANSFYDAIVLTECTLELDHNKPFTCVKIKLFSSK